MFCGNMFFKNMLTCDTSNEYEGLTEYFFKKHASTFDRSNEYDGLTEYWVKVREKGERVAESAHEEKHVKESQALTSLTSVSPGELVAEYVVAPHLPSYANFLGCAEADKDPSWDMPTVDGLDAYKARQEKAKALVVERPQQDKYAQAQPICDSDLLTFFKGGICEPRVVDETRPTCSVFNIPGPLLDERSSTYLPAVDDVQKWEDEIRNP